MSLSAASEIFLLPLSVSLTSANGESQKGFRSKPSAGGLSSVTEQRDGHPLGSRLSLESCFLADNANALLRVFDDLSCLESVSSPIVLYGPSQTGKSLLSRSVAHRWAKVRAYRSYQHYVAEAANTASQAELGEDAAGSVYGRAISISAADWSRQLHEAIETNSLTEFRERFVAAGTVQIDDLTQLKNSPFSQGQLVILLDLLEEAGVPVFVTSAQHPAQLEEFRPDLVSRLLGGMVLPVNVPGPAAKRTYIRERAERLGLRLPEASFDWLVNHAPLPTFASLEGFLQEFSVRSKLSQSDPSIGEIQACFVEACSDSLDQLPDLVINTVAEFFELTGEQLGSSCRRQTTVLARGLALSLIRHVYPLSLAALGQLFGNRDHSTVRSALQATERRIQTDQTIRASVVEIFKRIKSKAIEQKIAVPHTELAIEQIFIVSKQKDTT
jgi:chromosomal replication initiation ATPase DnaA